MELSKMQSPMFEHTASPQLLRARQLYEREVYLTSDYAAM